MWQAISQQVSNILEKPFVITEHETIDGGEINECYVISNGEERYFVKINKKSMLGLFVSEVESLNHLRNADCVDVPEVIHVGTTKECSFLVLNYLPTKPLLNEEQSETLGIQLARQHQWGEQAEFGFDSDNYIGSTLQPNEWHRKWSTFFSEQRLGWQLQLAAEKGIKLGNINTIVHNSQKILAHHHPRPSLLHGDLWHGNVSVSVSGPIMYDPACYWGDHECDIAMAELFGGFSEAFFNGYLSVQSLDKGYPDRRDLYNLYHILNHCNMFGGDYLVHAEQIISKLKLN